MTVKYFYSNGVSRIKVKHSPAFEMVSFGTAMIGGVAVSAKKPNTKCVLLPGGKKNEEERTCWSIPIKRYMFHNACTMLSVVLHCLFVL